ncbi:MAG: response regulator transcription factor [Deltaproteobacteria bacterium]|nr:response regulator transcription factor [Deltaproteobacteria bacterium]
MTGVFMGQMPHLGERILLVDEDLDFVHRVDDILRQRGYQVCTACDCQEAVQRMGNHRPALVILDVTLADADGQGACQHMRAMLDVPMIILAPGGKEEDIVYVLECCDADDYLIKPFFVEELLTRMGVLLRRTALSAPRMVPSVYSDGYLTVNLDERRVEVRGKLVRLTRTEYRLLLHLLENAGRIVTYEQLLKQVWGQEYLDYPNYVRTYIWRLRQKIEKEPRQPKYILTEHEVGYRFETAC